ncbi:MAG: YbaB/EbfC family nucleoid-associated protein, partial [Clostridia bacterium]|nr:YbaB/EbfC family nucleoid-associated protein [Clostridia bacterium]
DIEMLEDLIVAGFKEACAKADEMASSKMPTGINGLM